MVSSESAVLLSSLGMTYILRASASLTWYTVNTHALKAYGSVVSHGPPGRGW